MIPVRTADQWCNMQHMIELRELVANASDKHFDMNHWYQFDKDGYRSEVVLGFTDEQTACGTTACLAGYACLLTQQARMKGGITRSMADADDWVADVAAAVLGIPDRAKMLLFARVHWPEAYYTHSYNVTHREAALALLDDIIAGHVKMVRCTEEDEDICEGLGGWKWDVNYETSSLSSHSPLQSSEAATSSDGTASTGHLPAPF